jgi:hypothetical protein
MRAFLRGLAAMSEGMAMIGEGMAGVFDLGAMDARRRLGSFEDDKAALARDWEAVGQDLWTAMDGFEAGLDDEQRSRLTQGRRVRAGVS